MEWRNIYDKRMYAHIWENFLSRYLPCECENETSFIVCETWHLHSTQTSPQSLRDPSRRWEVSSSLLLHSLLSPQFTWTSCSPPTTHSWRTSVSSTPSAYDLFLKIGLFFCIISYPVTLVLHYNAWNLWPSAATQHYVGGNRQHLQEIYCLLYKHVLFVSPGCKYIPFYKIFSCHYEPTQQLNVSSTTKDWFHNRSEDSEWILSKMQQMLCFLLCLHFPKSPNSHEMMKEEEGSTWIHVAHCCLPQEEILGASAVLP